MDKIILASLAGVFVGIWVGGFFQALKRAVGWMLAGNFSYRDNKKNYRNFFYFLFMILVFVLFLGRVGQIEMFERTPGGIVGFLWQSLGHIVDYLSSNHVEAMFFLVVFLIMSVLTYKYARF